MAATLTEDELTRVTFADIAKWEEGPDGTLYVYGRATSPDLDTDEQVVSPAWSGASLKTWLAEAPALRVQHNPQRDPAGSGVKVEVDRDGDGAHWVKAAVDEPIAARLVKRGHLRAFSIGIAKPVVERDMTGKARGGIITGGKIVEVSLVDSPANRSCFFELAKADKSGTAEFTGKVGGDDDFIAKAATAEASATKTGGGFSPNDMKKLAEARRVAEQRQADGDHAVFKAMLTAETAVYKRDIDTATRRRLRSQGRALSNLSYPVETHEDADNAVTLILSGHGDVGAARKMVRRVARKEGWQDILDRLDGKKKEKSVDTAPEAMAVKDAEPDGDQPDSMPETAPPEAVKADGGDPHEPVLHHDDGEDDDTDSDADANEKAARDQPVTKYGWTPEQLRDMLPDGAVAAIFAAEQAAEKGAMPAKMPKVPCPKCKAMCKPKAKFCGKCGGPMMAEKADKPTPGDGVTGAAAAAIEPVPEHREPDGPAFEALEHDAGLPTVPDASVKTAVKMSELGVPNQEGMLHDLLCPAYPGASVKAAWPGADLSLVDEQGWQAKAFEASTSAPLGEFQQAAEKASQAWTAARILKSVPADLYEEVMDRGAQGVPRREPRPRQRPAARRDERAAVQPAVHHSRPLRPLPGPRRPEQGPHPPGAHLRLRLQPGPHHRRARRRLPRERQPPADARSRARGSRRPVPRLLHEHAAAERGAGHAADARPHRADVPRPVPHARARPDGRAAVARPARRGRGRRAGTARREQGGRAGGRQEPQRRRRRRPASAS